MASLTMQQRLLFIGLFSNADDQGRLRAHPSLIRSMVFPYEDVPVDEIQHDLDALEGAQSIYVYATEGKPYLQIVNWWKYQSPQWAYPSDIPSPDGWHDRLRYRRENEVLTDNWPTKDQPEPLPNALPKDLPNDLPNGLPGEDTQSDRWPHSVRVSTSISTSVSGSGSEDDLKGADAPSPTTFSIPTCWDDWEEHYKTRKNTPALIHRMVEVLYPGLDPPDYGEIGGIAKKMGKGKAGYHRLMGLLWEYSKRPPDGDLLPYLLRVHQGKERDDGRGPKEDVNSAEWRRRYASDLTMPIEVEPP